jgi:aryl-alcohol dehydrogenase-like predicted oxidoreductase
MQKRKIANTTLEVPVIMLGGNVFGWTVDEAASFRLLDAAFDAGLNFIDTADVYSRWIPGHVGGESETILGKWIARSGKRDKVVIATKLGMDMGDGKQGLSAKYMVEAVEASLRRLQTDHIDLYQSHKDDDKTPLEETLGAFDKLVKQGKVRFIGASNYNGARLREAMEVSQRHGFAGYVTLQPHYNLLERENYESDLAPVVAQYGLGVIPYFSLASGFLTGKYRASSDLEGQPRGRMVEKYLNARGLAVLDALDAVAKQHNSTPAAVALAWVIAQPNILAPIASATNEKQLADLVAAAELKLDRESLEKLSAASATAAAGSGR